MGITWINIVAQIMVIIFILMIIAHGIDLIISWKKERENKKNEQY